MLACFYPILDTAVLKSRDCGVLETAEVLLESGVSVVQYRHKDAWTQNEYDEAEKLAQMCVQAKAQFVINDRADFAKLLGAGLHIGQDDLPAVAARKIVGEDTLLGLSTHNKRQLSFGNEEPVDYLSLGPIFATSSKQNPDPTVGVDGLRSLRPLTEKPICAIGGITLENAAQVFEAGADSIAVITGFLPAACTKPEIRKRVAEWLQLKPTR